MSRLSDSVGLKGIFLVSLWLAGCGQPASPGRLPDTANRTAEASTVSTATEPVKVQDAAPVSAGQKISGVGIALGKEEEDLVIKIILPDSAAALNKAIQVGDRVVAMAENDKPAVKHQGKTVTEAVGLIRGPHGTTVRLTLIPAGKDESQARDVYLVRGELNLSDKAIALKDMPGWGDGVLLATGTKAPNFTMTPLPSQKSEHLLDFAGKVVVLVFWSTGCAGCHQVMADLQSYPGKHPDWKDKVVLISASVQEEGDADVKLLKAKGWNLTHNVRVGFEAKIAYHVGAIPTTYVIDQQGNIVAADYVLDIPNIVTGLIRSKNRPMCKIKKNLVSA
jgi:peroxiredoxin